MSISPEERKFYAGLMVVMGGACLATGIGYLLLGWPGTVILLGTCLIGGALFVARQT